MLSKKYPHTILCPHHSLASFDGLVLLNLYLIFKKIHVMKNFIMVKILKLIMRVS